MQDRPTIDELLAAVENFLDTEIVPNVPGATGFHGRVAANAIRIVRRELEREDAQLAAEWAGLDAILGPLERAGGRHGAASGPTRPQRGALLAHSHRPGRRGRHGRPCPGARTVALSWTSCA